MAMAALHLLRRNTGRKMHPTISHQFKTSLSPPLLPSFCSFPLFPPRILECQSTTVAGLNIIKCFHIQQKYTWSKGSGGIPPTPTPSQLSQSIKQMVQGIRCCASFTFDGNFRPNNKRERDQEFRHPNDGPPGGSKRPKIEVVGQSEARTTITTTTGDHHHDLSNNVNISLEVMGDGEYVVKIKRSSSSTGGSSLTRHEEVEKAKQMAQNAAMLILHGGLLQDMGKKLLAQSQASLRSIYGIGMPAPPPAPPSDLQL